MSTSPSDSKNQRKCFQIGEEIGRGVYGKVHLGVLDGIACAIKVMTFSETLDATIREIMIAQLVSSPYLNTAHFGISRNKTAYLFYNLMEGDMTTLTNDRIDPIDLAFQLLQGLDAMHRVGIVHNDVKAENVLWTSTPSGRILYKWCDFSISHIPWKASSNTTFPSPNYIETGFATPRTDIWGLGRIIYMVITGERFECLGWGTHNSARLRYQRAIKAGQEPTGGYADLMKSYGGRECLVRSHYILEAISKIKLEGEFGVMVMNMLREKRIRADEYLRSPLFATLNSLPPPSPTAPSLSITGGMEKKKGYIIYDNMAPHPVTCQTQLKVKGLPSFVDRGKMKHLISFLLMERGVVLTDEGKGEWEEMVRDYLDALKLGHLMLLDPLLTSADTHSLSGVAKNNVRLVELLEFFHGNICCISDEGACRY